MVPTDWKSFSHFPQEVLDRILSYYHPEPADLWCQCRPVCTGFRTTVDKIFEENYLTKTIIYFNLGWDLLDKEELSDQCNFEIICRFSHLLAEDENVAIFKAQEHQEDRPVEWQARYYETERRKWECKISRHFSSSQGKKRFHDPPWAVLVGRSANDTELPGFSIDYRNREIRCRWKDMFQCFFREEQYMIGKIEEDARGTEPAVLPSLVDQRNISFKEVSDDMYGLWRASRGKARKTIRRHRLKKWYKENADFDFPGDQCQTNESYCLQALARIEENAQGEFFHSEDDADGLEWILGYYLAIASYLLGWGQCDADSHENRSDIGAGGLSAFLDILGPFLDVPEDEHPERKLESAAFDMEVVNGKLRLKTY